jgi:hypothetical protein
MNIKNEIVKLGYCSVIDSVWDLVNDSVIVSIRNSVYGSVATLVDDNLVDVDVSVSTVMDEYEY